MPGQNENEVVVAVKLKNDNFDAGIKKINENLESVAKNISAINTRISNFNKKLTSSVIGDDAIKAAESYKKGTALLVKAHEERISALKALRKKENAARDAALYDDVDARGMYRTGRFTRPEYREYLRSRQGNTQNNPGDERRLLGAQYGLDLQEQRDAQQAAALRRRLRRQELEAAFRANKDAGSYVALQRFNRGVLNFNSGEAVTSGSRAALSSTEIAAANRSYLSVRAAMLSALQKDADQMSRSIKSASPRAGILQSFSRMDKASRALYNGPFYGPELAAGVAGLTETEEAQIRQRLVQGHTRRQIADLRRRGEAMSNVAGGLHRMGDNALIGGGLLAAGAGLSIRDYMESQGQFALLSARLRGDMPGMSRQDQNVRINQIYRQLRESTYKGDYIPVSAKDMFNIAESGVTSGIGPNDIVRYARGVARTAYVSTNRLGNRSNPEFVATAMGQILGMSAMEGGPNAGKKGEIGGNVERLGDLLMALDEKTKGSSEEILKMGLRLTKTAAAAGMSTEKIMALSAGMVDAGLRAEMGGSAMGRLMMRMLDVSTASKGAKRDLENFARVAGMSGADFKKLFLADPGTAMFKFITGLQTRKNLPQDLKTLGIASTRDQQTALATANAQMFPRIFGVAGGNFTGKLQQRISDAKDNPAAEWQRLKSDLKDLSVEIGETLIPTLRELMPHFKALLDAVREGVRWFKDLPDPIKKAAINLGLFGIASGPILKLLGGLASTGGSLFRMAAGFKELQLAAKAAPLVEAAGGLATLGTGAANASANVLLLLTNLNKLGALLQAGALPALAIGAGAALGYLVANAMNARSEALEKDAGQPLGTSGEIRARIGANKNVISYLQDQLQYRNLMGPERLESSAGKYGITEGQIQQIYAISGGSEGGYAGLERALSFYQGENRVQSKRLAQTEQRERDRAAEAARRAAEAKRKLSEANEKAYRELLAKQTKAQREADQRTELEFAQMRYTRAQSVVGDLMDKQRETGTPMKSLFGAISAVQGAGYQVAEMKRLVGLIEDPDNPLTDAQKRLVGATAQADKADVDKLVAGLRRAAKAALEQGQALTRRNNAALFKKQAEEIAARIEVVKGEQALAKNLQSQHFYAKKILDLQMEHLDYATAASLTEVKTGKEREAIVEAYKKKRIALDKDRGLEDEQFTGRKMQGFAALAAAKAGASPDALEALFLQKRAIAYQLSDPTVSDEDKANLREQMKGADLGIMRQVYQNGLDSDEFAYGAENDPRLKRQLFNRIAAGRFSLALGDPAKEGLTTAMNAEEARKLDQQAALASLTSALQSYALNGVGSPSEALGALRGQIGSARYGEQGPLAQSALDQIMQASALSMALDGRGARFGMRQSLPMLNQLLGEIKIARGGDSAAYSGASDSVAGFVTGSLSGEMDRIRRLPGGGRRASEMRRLLRDLSSLPEIHNLPEQTRRKITDSLKDLGREADANDPFRSNLRAAGENVGGVADKGGVDLLARFLMGGAGRQGGRQYWRQAMKQFWSELWTAGTQSLASVAWNGVLKPKFAQIFTGLKGELAGIFGAANQSIFRAISTIMGLMNILSSSGKRRSGGILGAILGGVVGSVVPGLGWLAGASIWSSVFGNLAAGDVGGAVLSGITAYGSVARASTGNPNAYGNLTAAPGRSVRLPGQGRSGPLVQMNVDKFIQAKDEQWQFGSAAMRLQRARLTNA